MTTFDDYYFKMRSQGKELLSEDSKLFFYYGFTKNDYHNLSGSGVDMTAIKELLTGGLKEKRVRELDFARNSLKSSEPFIKNRMSRYVSKLDKVLENNYSLILFGPNSKGKSFIANYLLLKAYKEGYTVHNIQMRELSKIYNKEHFTQDETLYEEIVNSEFLVIDEMGKEPSTSNSLAACEEILKYRSRMGLVTILVTNLGVKEKNGVSGFKNRYGTSVTHILYKDYFAFLFTSEDNERLKGRKEWNL